MKIAIITLPIKTNIGGILQAYALQTTLTDLGHEVEVLDKPHYYRMPLWKMFFLFPIRAVKKYFLHDNQGIFREYVHNKNFPIISQNTETFVKKYLNRREVANLAEVKQGEYEGFVLGSDQVWRRMYYETIEPVYLDFASAWNVKRIAYAASFGAKDWTYSEQETLNCQLLISKFDAVSLREDDGVTLVKNHLHYKNAVHVLDPTMLLDLSQYIGLFKAANTPRSKGSLLKYVLDANDAKNQVVNNVALHLQLAPFSVASEFYEQKVSAKMRIQPAVETWLRGFYDAEFVITDSFHATVFSILFQKQFIVIGNEKRGLSRFYSLLSMFGLSDRLILNPSDNYIDVIDKKINYSVVNSILEIKKKESLAFLKSNL